MDFKPKLSPSFSCLLLGATSVNGIFLFSRCEGRVGQDQIFRVASLGPFLRHDSSLLSGGGGGTDTRRRRRLPLSRLFSHFNAALSLGNECGTVGGDCSERSREVTSGRPPFPAFMRIKISREKMFKKWVSPFLASFRNRGEREREREREEGRCMISR